MHLRGYDSKDSRFKSIYSTMYRHQSYKSTEQCEKKNESNIFWWVHVWRPSLRPYGHYHKGHQKWMRHCMCLIKESLTNVVSLLLSFSIIILLYSPPLTHWSLGDLGAILKCNFQSCLLIDIFRSSNDNAFKWMPQDLTGDKLTLVQVMAWCRQATSHYLNHC